MYVLALKPVNDMDQSRLVPWGIYPLRQNKYRVNIVLLNNKSINILLFKLKLGFETIYAGCSVFWPESSAGLVIWILYFLVPRVDWQVG